MENDVWDKRGYISEECDIFVSYDIYYAGDRLARKTSSYEE